MDKEQLKDNIKKLNKDGDIFQGQHWCNNCRDWYGKELTECPECDLLKESDRRQQLLSQLDIEKKILLDRQEDIIKIKKDISKMEIELTRSVTTYKATEQG